MLKAKSCISSVFSRNEIDQHLASILANPEFTATPQQAALLKYVVDQTLDGNAERIKGYTVATEVFGRNSDFDQNIDPIVSIQAGRLRRALARYYESAGQNDPLQIEIPKGTYIPDFKMCRRTKAAAAPPLSLKPGIAARSARYWPTVEVRPLHNVSDNQALDNWSAGLAAELADELTRYPDIRVMPPVAGQAKKASNQPGPCFVIEGCVRSDANIIKVILSLTDVRNGQQLWSSSCRCEVGSGSVIAFQERVARMAAVKVAGKRGWIAKTLGREFQKGGPPGSEAYEAIIRYNEFRSSSTPAAFKRALAALERAVEADPDCGQVWTTHARLFATIHALEIPGFDHPLDRARTSILKALRLMPDDQRNHGVMAFIYLLQGDLAAGRLEAERALELGYDTLFILDGIGYLLTLLGEWERGSALIEKIIRRNPFYSNYAHYALWLNWIRQGDYEHAYQETMKLNRPADFWDHLAKAATLGLLGRIEEGRKAAAELLELKPDFPEIGRRLIGHFIKFDAIADRVIQGLATVGVAVK